MTNALTLKSISDCSSSSSDTQQAAFLKNSAKKISSSTSVMIQHDSLYEKYPSTQLITQELFIYFKIHMLICTFFFHLFPTVKKIIRGSSYTIIETIPTVHPTGIRIISLSGPNQFSKSRAIICRSSELTITHCSKLG